MKVFVIIMRLATFNVENMFERPAIMNLPQWKDGEKVLQDFTVLSNLIEKPTYSAADKKRILEIIKKRHRTLIKSGQTKYLRLNEIRGKLLKKPRNAPVEVAVNGRDEWIGWFELNRETIKRSSN